MGRGLSGPYIVDSRNDRGGHLGFVGRGGQRWAFEAALGFLESAVEDAEDA
jgi:hypothetical protein